MIEPHNELTGALLDIYYELRNTPIQPKIVGGLGIYLRARDVFAREADTLVALMGARATQDIDMMLPPEAIIVPDLRSRFKSMLDGLGFTVIEKFSYWQFKRYYYQHEQKLDLHTWMPRHASSETFRIEDEKLKSADAGAELDAHIANEAVAADSLATEIVCSGYRNEGTFFECTVSVSHPITLLVMKLLAYRDYEAKAITSGMRGEAARRDLLFAQKHAFDVYALLSTVTEDEWNQMKELALVYRDIDAIRDAGAVVRDAFANVNASGMVRMRSSLDASPTMQFDAVPSLLFELFAIE